MASENKREKTNKRKHWGRDGKFLKYTNKFKGLNFFNSSLRKKLKREIDESLRAYNEEAY